MILCVFLKLEEEDGARRFKEKIVDPGISLSLSLSGNQVSNLIIHSLDLLTSIFMRVLVPKPWS